MFAKPSWVHPVLVLLAGRGGCLEKGSLSALLWVKPSTVKRIVWGLRRRGLALQEGDRVCISRKGFREIEWVEVLARKRNHFVAAGKGVILLVSYRDRGASVYVSGLREFCRVTEALGRGHARPRELAEAAGTAPKTASYLAKAAGILGCPGPGCPVNCGL